MKECSSHFLKEMKRSRFCCYLLSVSGKNDYILLLNKQRHHQINILSSRRDIANSKIRFRKKNRKRFLHSYCSRKTHFGNTLVFERVRQCGEIQPRLIYFSGCFAQLNATRFFVWITYLQKKRVKDICDTLLLFFFKRVKPDNFQFCISKTTSARGCKLSNHERILSYSTFGTLHRRRFHLSLARELTSSFTRSCYWEEFDVL